MNVKTLITRLIGLGLTAKGASDMAKTMIDTGAGEVISGDKKVGDWLKMYAESQTNQWRRGQPIMLGAGLTILGVDLVEAFGLKKKRKRASKKKAAQGKTTVKVIKAK